MKHNGTQMIETERLYLRRFEMNDMRDMLENWIANTNVQSEYCEPVYKTEKEVSQLLESWINQYDKVDFYRWAIVLKNEDINIGQIAFCKVYSDVETAEIEYCISEKYWGNGYVGEALSAVVEYTFKYTDFNKLEAYHREANSKSGRVLEKSSMNRTDTIRRFILLNEEPLGEKCYALTKEDYFEGEIT